jgi:hypothetical protein
MLVRGSNNIIAFLTARFRFKTSNNNTATRARYYRAHAAVHNHTVAEVPDFEILIGPIQF